MIDKIKDINKGYLYDDPWDNTIHDEVKNTEIILYTHMTIALPMDVHILLVTNLYMT